MTILGGAGTPLGPGDGRGHHQIPSTFFQRSTIRSCTDFFSFLPDGLEKVGRQRRRLVCR
jgi:hypothetical protein